MYCVTIRQYTPNLQVQYSTVQYCVVQCSTSPNLQDDSDANNNDSAGRMLKMEKACEKVNIALTSTADMTLQIHQSRGWQCADLSWGCTLGLLKRACK